MEILRTLKPASRSLSPLHPTAGGAGRHSRSGRENTPPLHPNVQASSPTLPKKPSATTTPKVDLFSKESTRSEEYPPDSSKNCSNPYVKVVVRVRPVNSQEEKGNACCVRKVSDDSLAVGDRKYTVNSVLGPESTQEDVFKLVGVPLVENSLAGFNTSIVSYGQTGSGKTYTMWGPPSAMVDNRFIDGRQGIVPRIFQLLFSEIQRKQENSEEKQENYQCRCSFLEIHNGQINDLLDPTQRSLQIRDDSRNGFHVENLTDEYVTTVEDVTQILIKGLSNRKVGATSMNSKSSRSHIIFTCVIESWCKGPSSSCFSSSKSSKINLIDLAGSDIDEFDGVSKQCIKEGRHVKKSLARLGKLVNILADVTSSGRDQKNLYMDSCLTHLLKDTLGGNSKTTLICAISSDDRCKSGTLSTLRFGERAKNIENKAVVNEITEDDVNGLSDQIRQLKEELIRTKSYRDIPNGTNTAEHFKGHNARDSLKLLRVNLNRSLILPHIDIESEEEMDVDEEDVRELCDQISTLHSSSEDKLKDMLENKDQLCDTSEVSLELEKDEEIEEEHSEVSEPTACSSIAASTKSSLVCGDAFEDANDNPLLGSPTKCSLSISPCQLVPVLQDPTLCSSPKFDAKFKKNVISPGLLSVGKRSASGCSISNSIKDSPGKVDGVRSSLQSTKLNPTESLAASLHHGLQMIDYHHRNSASRRSFVALSFDHLALNSCHSVEKDNSGIQTSPYEQRNISSFLCSSCKKVVENENDVISDKSDMDIMPISETSDSNTLHKSSLKEDNIVPTKASKREMELEVLCAEREARIKHLSSLIDQCKQGDCQSSTREQSKDAQILSVASLTDDGLTTVKGLRSEGNTSLEAEHTLLVGKSIKQSLASKPEDSLKQQDGSTAFDSCEREALLCEIESLRNQLKKSYTTNSVDDSLLDQIRNGGTPPSGVTEEELEKERQRWTESESRWISLTEELRLDLESNRRFAEKKEIELNQEKECTAELDDALQRAIHGHAMIVEHYVELQENYNDLFEKHRKVMEGIAEVKKAALKAGRKGSGSAFAAALSAELSTLRIDREKERAYLKEQNRRLRIQLRDTAEAVHAAGELLVRLREAEAAVSQAEAKNAGAHQEIDRLRKQNDKMKKKHAMEIITMKHYLAESRLPESALEPFYLNESETVENSKPPASDEDQSWRAAFGPAYR